MAKLGTQFQPITNPANTRLLTLIDESTGLRYKINIADFFAVVATGAEFAGTVQTQTLNVGKTASPKTLTVTGSTSLGGVVISNDTQPLAKVFIEWDGSNNSRINLRDATGASATITGIAGTATFSGNIDMTAGKFTQTVGFAGGFAMEVINSNNGGSGLRIQGGGTSGVNFIIAGFNQAGVERFNIDDFGAVTFVNLAGTGTRAVMVDANGLLSAP